MHHVRQLLRGVLRPRQSFAFAVVALAMLAIPATAGATPPSNDNFADATVIGSLPFSESLATGQATVEQDEPSYCIGLPHSVWYRYQPQHDGWLSVGLTADNATAGALVYKFSGTSGFGDFIDVEACVANVGSRTFFAQAGYTYYIQVGTQDGEPSDVSISLTELVSPPPNDDFDQATAVSSIPYVDGLDLHLLTAAVDDPTDCFSANNAWYRFTAPSSEPVRVAVNGAFLTGVATYTGTRGSLVNVACAPLGFDFGGSFNAVRGTTYYIDVGWFTFAPEGLETGTVTIARTFSLNDPSIDAKGRLTDSGVSVSGRLTCNASGSGASLNVDVTQTRGRNTLHGQASIASTCSPTGDHWTGAVVPDSGHFRGGPATVTVSAVACGQPPGGFFDCQQKSTTRAVNFED